jgi:hypothetical protein
MGPGRWGSRGDIKLGVSVTYSDIYNTAALIEIARQTGGYAPEVSFGTHFFQDLVEARIHYLPLYPDDDGVTFNETFLTQSENLMAQLLPEFASLSDTVRLIDVPKSTDGLTLHLLMNADLNEAIALLAAPGGGDERDAPTKGEGLDRDTTAYSRWRLRMAEQIAASLSPQDFGVMALYVFGSTKNATAGPASDIDLLIHFRGTDAQRDRLESWLRGWSQCLDEINFLQTGFRSGGLLDAHLITDDDIAKKTSYAVKVGAVTDAAKPLRIGKGG